MAKTQEEQATRFEHTVPLMNVEAAKDYTTCNLPRECGSCILTAQEHHSA